MPAPYLAGRRELIRQRIELFVGNQTTERGE